MTDRPPFSGDDPTCPKCANVGATTKYLGFGVCQHGTGMTLGYEQSERLHRECRRCGYEWDEALAEPVQQGDARRA